jgi:hypothetical protein
MRLITSELPAGPAVFPPVAPVVALAGAENESIATSARTTMFIVENHERDGRRSRRRAVIELIICKVLKI